MHIDMGWSSKLAAKRRRRIVEEFLGDSDESDEADAYSIESDGVSAIIEHENEDPHEVAAEASEDSNKDSLVQMNRNDSLVTQPSPQMDKKSNKRTGSTRGLDSLATLAAQEIGTSHTMSEKSIDNLVVSFDNSPPDQGNHTSSQAVLVEDPTKSTRTTDMLESHMNPGSTLETPPVVDRSECPETQQQDTFADVRVVPDKSETTKKKFSRLKKRKNKSTLNDVSLSSTDVELEPKASSVEFETKKTIVSNEVKTNKIPCNIDLTTGDDELEQNVLRKPEVSNDVVSTNNNDHVVTKQQQVVKRKRRKVAASATGIKEPKAPPKEEAIPQPKDRGGKRSDVSGGVVMTNGSEKLSKGDIQESSHTKKRAAEPEPDSTQPVLKKKIKLTYQDQVLKHMLIACKPFSMKTLAMETRSTTEALHHLMLSLVDKGLVVKKEFVSAKGKSKELIWANQEAKSRVMPAVSEDEMNAAPQEMDELKQKDIFISNQIGALLKEPANDELESQVQQMESELKAQRQQLVDAKIRVESNKQTKILTKKNPLGAQKSEQQMAREQCPRRMKMRINAMRSEWKKRKDKTTDFVEMLADGMEKKVKDVIKLLDVETDESEGVKMPPKHIVDAE